MLQSQNTAGRQEFGIKRKIGFSALPGKGACSKLWPSKTVSPLGGRGSEEGVGGFIGEYRV